MLVPSRRRKIINLSDFNDLIKEMTTSTAIKMSIDTYPLTNPHNSNTESTSDRQFIYTLSKL